MMMQDDNVSFYRGYGQYTPRSQQLAGRDPNSFRSPFPSKGPSLLMLVLGAVAAYYLYKHLKKKA